MVMVVGRLVLKVRCCFPREGGSAKTGNSHRYVVPLVHPADHMPQQGGWFYPASGETHTADAIKNPSVVETPNLADFILSQSWTRMGDDSRANCCKIMNCGFSLPRPGSIPGMQRLELRSTYRQMVLPALRKFDPDIIFISAGFDAHKSDTMNFGYVGMLEDDYEWVTEQLVKIANTCCNGRIVSVLEGGYKIHGGIVSPFARSVASHVRALVDGGRSRELYDQEDCNWESQFERHVVEERERKRGMKKEQLEREVRRAGVLEPHFLAICSVLTLYSSHSISAKWRYVVVLKKATL